MRRRAPSALLARFGWRVRRLGPDAWLVGRTGHGRRVRLVAVDEGSWLVQDRSVPARWVRRIGPAELRTSLAVNRRAARANPHLLQRDLTRFLVREQLAWTLDALRINCVLDVGANIGQYAAMLRAGGYRGRIVSFEPVPELLAQLRAQADPDPEWWVYGVALGEQTGTSEIHVSAGAMSSLLPASEFGRAWSPNLRQTTSLSIPVRRLDDLLAEVTEGLDEPRLFLKLDTQGFDLPAFRGLGDRVGTILGLQSELSCLPVYQQMTPLTEHLAAYLDAGFELAGMFPVSRHQRTQRVIEFDAIMVRAGAFDAGPATV